MFWNTHLKSYSFVMQLSLIRQTDQSYKNYTQIVQRCLERIPYLSMYCMLLPHSHYRHHLNLIPLLFNFVLTYDFNFGHWGEHHQSKSLFRRVRKYLPFIGPNVNHVRGKHCIAMDTPLMLSINHQCSFGFLYFLQRAHLHELYHRNNGILHGSRRKMRCFSAKVAILGIFNDQERFIFKDYKANIVVNCIIQFR